MPTLSQPLQQHQSDLSKNFSLRSSLNDPARFTAMSFTIKNILFDFSKHLATPDTIKLLANLARERGLEAARERMFAGEKINMTEGRAVLHTALRAPVTATIMCDGENVIPYVHNVLSRMREFAENVISGRHTGYSGKRITDIVNIGIGGSDLGPRFVCEALQNYSSGLKAHFVSNVDGAAISNVLRTLNPETTLVIVASKTFTTEETMLNANVAKTWLVQKSGSPASVARNFVALSTNEKAVAEFGINEDLTFPFRDWVGGRYSLWSAIGLSIMLSVGAANFDQLLAGAHAMDTHFREAPLEQNIPVLMGLLGVWYRNFWDYPAQLLLPYDERLQHLAKFVQQMDMESNGKAVSVDGATVSYETAPFLFGEPGTDTQHSFMQLVHQGTTPVPADFIVCAKPHHDLTKNHEVLIANCLAQTRALAIGQTLAEADGDPFRVFSGNRPSTTIVLPQLSPFTLGLLLAAYEHKVFVQGIVWNLNSFDQPGVELGKKLAKAISQANGVPLDASTDGILTYIRQS